MSASAQAVASDRTILRADLPVMTHETTPEFEAMNLPYRVSFDHCEDDPGLYTCLLVEWNDGLTLFFDKMGTAAFNHLVDTGIHPDRVMQAIHAEPERYNNIYRVID